MKILDYSYKNDDEYNYVRSLPCELEFNYIDKDTINHLQSLKLTSYEGYNLLLNNFCIDGNILKNVYFIFVRLENEKQNEKFHNMLNEKYRKRHSNIRQYILLLDDKPVYIFLDYSAWADGTSVDILEVISDYHTKENIDLLRQIISECAMLKFSGGPEYWYTDRNAIFKLNNKQI